VKGGKGGQGKKQGKEGNPRKDNRLPKRGGNAKWRSVFKRKERGRERSQGHRKGGDKEKTAQMSRGMNEKQTAVGHWGDLASTVLILKKSGISRKGKGVGLPRYQDLKTNQRGRRGDKSRDAMPVSGEKGAALLLPGPSTERKKGEKRENRRRGAVTGRGQRS